MLKQQQLIISSFDEANKFRSFKEISEQVRICFQMQNKIQLGEKNNQVIIENLI